MGNRHNILTSDMTTTYPDYRGGNGFVQNLSKYRAGCRINGLDDGRLVLGDENLAFDVERQVSWDAKYNLREFGYSVTISGRYPISFWPLLSEKSRPGKEEFARTASQLEGFVLDEESYWMKNGGLFYRNSDKAVSIKWVKNNRIGISVMQDKPTSGLDVVVNEIVPYAVSVFNRLSPTLQLPDVVVQISIDMALLSDKSVPRCRIERS